MLAHMGARLVDDSGRPVTDFLHRPRDKQKYENAIRREATHGSSDLRREILLEAGIFDPRDD